MYKVVIQGRAGSVRWGYHSAADLAAWTITNDTLTGTVSTVDEFRVSQRPLIFVVTRVNGDWTWPITTLQIVDRTLTATLDLREGT